MFCNYTPLFEAFSCSTSKQCDWHQALFCIRSGSVLVCKEINIHVVMNDASSDGKEEQTVAALSHLSRVSHQRFHPSWSQNRFIIPCTLQDAEGSVQDPRANLSLTPLELGFHPRSVPPTELSRKRQNNEKNSIAHGELLSSAIPTAVLLPEGGRT